MTRALEFVIAVLIACALCIGCGYDREVAPANAAGLWCMSVVPPSADAGCWRLPWQARVAIAQHPDGSITGGSATAKDAACETLSPNEYRRTGAVTGDVAGPDVTLLFAWSNAPLWPAFTVRADSEGGRLSGVLRTLDGGLCDVTLARMEASRQ